MKKKYHSFLSEKNEFLEVRISICLNKRVFVSHINVFINIIYLFYSNAPSDFAIMASDEIKAGKRDKCVLASSEKRNLLGASVIAKTFLNLFTIFGLSACCNDIGAITDVLPDRWRYMFLFLCSLLTKKKILVTLFPTKSAPQSPKHVSHSVLQNTS